MVSNMESKKYYLIVGALYDIDNNVYKKCCVTCAANSDEAKRKVDKKLSDNGGYFVEYSTTMLDDTSVYEVF